LVMLQNVGGGNRDTEGGLIILGARLYYPRRFYKCYKAKMGKKRWNNEDSLKRGVWGG